MQVNAENVVLAYDAQDLLASQATDAEALDLLTREVRAHFGTATNVALDLSTRSLAGMNTVAREEAGKKRLELAAARELVQNHPLVREAISLFGAELREVRLPGEE